MFRSRLFRVTCLCWCVAAAPLHGQQGGIAHVLDVKGEWRIDGKSKLLTPGDALAMGIKIVAGSQRPDDFITIVHDEDLSRQRIACAVSPSPCLTPIAIQGASATQTDRGQMKGMVQAALAVLLDRPPAIASHYALTLTRGKETVREFEDVVALDPAQGLILPPPPADLPAGRYTISATLSDGKSATTEQTGILTASGSWRPLPLQATGLYQFSIANEDGDQLADAMVLVVPAAQYPSHRAAFDAMQAQTGAWTGPSARTDEHLFLRSFLLAANRP